MSKIIRRTFVAAAAATLATPYIRTAQAQAPARARAAGGAVQAAAAAVS